MATKTLEEKTIVAANMKAREEFRHNATTESTLKAIIAEKPVVTLCSKQWVPQANFTELPLCPACQLKASRR